MGAVALIICGIMGLVFLAAVVIIVIGNIYDRRATRKRQRHHSTYFEQ
jgi:hypothetical protein